MTTNGEFAEPITSEDPVAPAPLWQPTPQAGAALPSAPVTKTSSDAVVAFVLSLVSWAICPVIFAVVALIFAAKASKAIDVSSGQLTGGGLNLAAKIISWVNIGFWAAVLIVAAFVGLVLVLAGAGSQPALP